jgi:hypothetical protein
MGPAFRPIPDSSSPVPSQGVVISPCIDKGLTQAWMAGALDLAGIPRKKYGRVAGTAADPVVDMGCYETVVPAKGTLLLVW